MNDTHYWVDGAAATALPLTDRGLHYGDGLFETLAVRDGRVLHLDRHLARLRAGCARLGFDCPVSADELEGRARAQSRAVLKVIVTRGDGGRGYRAPRPAHPRRIIGLYPWPTHAHAHPAPAVAVRWCETPVAWQPALAGLKHLNRLEQVLARAEWGADDPWQEGLMCDPDGAVVAATQANLFIAAAGRVLTPRLDRCGIAGVARAVLMDAATTAGIPCTEARLDRATVERADEVWLCNSVIGVWPVHTLGAVRYDAPGPVTTRLAAAWERSCASY